MPCANGQYAWLQNEIMRNRVVSVAASTCSTKPGTPPSPLRSAEPEARRAEDEDDDDPAERRGEPPRASARPDKADERSPLENDPRLGSSTEAPPRSQSPSAGSAAETEALDAERWPRPSAASAPDARNPSCADASAASAKSAKSAPAASPTTRERARAAAARASEASSEGETPTATHPCRAEWPRDPPRSDRVSAGCAPAGSGAAEACVRIVLDSDVTRDCAVARGARSCGARARMIRNKRGVTRNACAGVQMPIRNFGVFRVRREE